MRRLALIALLSFVLASCAIAPQVPPNVRPDLAPTGKLRVGVSFGNPLLVTKDPATGEARGVAVDLGRELGKRIGVPVEFVTYQLSGSQLADTVKTGAWDVAFLGSDPERAAIVTFTASYAEIDATYLVPGGSALRSVADVDREGVRIAVAATTAFDAHLTRTLQHARLVRAQGTAGAFKTFVEEKLEALAGQGPVLLEYAEKNPGFRLLDGRFASLPQAIGIPRDRDAGARYLQGFVEDIKASGLVARLISKHGVRGLAVAP